VRKPLIALILGALTVGPIAGCGGGNDSSTASLPKGEYVKKADAICTTHHDNIEEKFFPVAEKSKGAGTRAGISKAVEVVMLPELRAEAKQIRALGVPSGDDEAANAILDAFEEGIEEIQRTVGNSGGTAPAIEKANELAKAFGLKTCMTS
jgi:hypothetical protein